MELLPENLRAKMPALCAHGEVPLDEKIIHIKFFIPDGGWTWFAAEGQEDGADYAFFGYIISEAGEEWGMFYLRELQEVNQKAEELASILDMSGLSVMRDTAFQAMPFKTALAAFRQQ